MGESFHQGWRRGSSCPSPRESGPEPGRRRFFWRPGGVRMRPHRRRIQEHSAGAGQRFGVQTFPEPLPDPTGLPASEAPVHGVPIPECGGQIAPRTAGALEMQQRFEELPVAEFAGSPRPRMLGRGHGRLELFPLGVADDFSHRMFGHPKFQS